MRRLAALVLAAPLMGCGPSFPTIDSAALAEAVAQVRGQTIKICNYFPSDSSLIGILTASHPVVESAYNLAKQICDAVTATVPAVNPAQMGGMREGDEDQCPMVRGVCITGRFTQPQQPPETGP
jgi:hypothetical protein